MGAGLPGLCRAAAGPPSVRAWPTDSQAASSYRQKPCARGQLYTATSAARQAMVRGHAQRCTAPCARQGVPSGRQGVLCGSRARVGGQRAGADLPVCGRRQLCPPAAAHSAEATPLARACAQRGCPSRCRANLQGSTACSTAPTLACRHVWGWHQRMLIPGHRRIRSSNGRHSREAKCGVHAGCRPRARPLPCSHSPAPARACPAVCRHSRDSRHSRACLESARGRHGPGARRGPAG